MCDGGIGRFVGRSVIHIIILLLHYILLRTGLLGGELNVSFSFFLLLALGCFGGGVGYVFCCKVYIFVFVR